MIEVPLYSTFVLYVLPLNLYLPSVQPPALCAPGCSEGHPLWRGAVLHVLHWSVASSVQLKWICYECNPKSGVCWRGIARMKELTLLNLTYIIMNNHSHVCWRDMHTFCILTNINSCWLQDLFFPKIVTDKGQNSTMMQNKHNEFVRGI